MLSNCIYVISAEVIPDAHNYKQVLGLVPTFSGMTTEQQFFFQVTWHFIQIGHEDLHMHFIGFASVDFSYTTMPISNF